MRPWPPFPREPIRGGRASRDPRQPGLRRSDGRPGPSRGQLMSDEIEDAGPENNAEGGPGRRRRRRRRRRRGGGGPDGEGGGSNGFPEDVLLVAEGGGHHGGNGGGNGGHGGGNGQRRSRRQVEVGGGPSVSLPASGRNPYRKRSTRARRGSPGSAAARRRR